MKVKSHLKWELPSNLAGKFSLTKALYQNSLRILNGHRVWVTTHADFNVWRRIQHGEEFCLEVYVLSLTKEATFYLDLKSPILVLIHVLEGVLLLQRGDEPEKTMAKKRSYLGTVPEGRYKVRIPAGKHIYFSSHLKLEVLEELSSVFSSFELLTSRIPQQLAEFSSAEFKASVLRLLYQTKRGKLRDSMAGFSLDARLWELFRSALEILEKPKLRQKAGAKQVVHRLREYLDNLAELGQTLPTIAELSDRLCLHPHHLARVFKSEFGIAPRDYIVGLKMKAGYKLLTQKNLPVHMVAFELGYQDPYSFARQFRAYFGFPPGKAKLNQPEKL
ncbi:hypothetical protein GCM10023091_14260 [Ravibacter arvi]|uniref:HTH araC/xylS-type domain-containing protein n=1 Tax=Ravibacter arvi TaxID=2051041 RepID=A0ABP8LV77_9BACT